MTLEQENAALRAHVNALRELVTTVPHGHHHWDKQGTHGLHCELCLAYREWDDRVQTVLRVAPKQSIAGRDRRIRDESNSRVKVDYIRLRAQFAVNTFGHEILRQFDAGTLDFHELNRLRLLRERDEEAEACAGLCDKLQEHAQVAFNDYEYGEQKGCEYCSDAIRARIAGRSGGKDGKA